MRMPSAPCLTRAARIPGSLLALLTACRHDTSSSGGVDSCARGTDSGCAAYTVSAGVTHALPAAVLLPDGARSIAVGDLVGTGVDQIYVGTDTTVTRLDGDGWTTATDIWTQADDVGAHPLIAELTGDGVPDLLIGLPNSDGGAGQIVLFEGPVVDPVSWDTPHLEIKGESGAPDPNDTAVLAGSAIWAADMDGDGGLDLVVKASGQTWIRPGPLTTSAPLGAVGDTEWADSTDAEQQETALGDIDGDGAPDLVFLVGPVDGPCGRMTFRIFAVPGPFTAGTFSLDDAPIVLERPPDAAGLDAIVVSDVDGDGLADVIASVASLIDAEALVWAGPLHDGDEPASSIQSLFGVVGIGDFTGDATPDLLELNLQSPGVPIDTGAQGLVTVTDGPSAAWASRANCDVAVSEAWTGWPVEFAQASWVGDLDGDGVMDAILATSQVEIVLGGSGG